MARPKEVPKWWPKEGKEGAWATCDYSGGYHIGIDVSCAIKKCSVPALKRDWLEEHDQREWEFKLFLL